MLTFSGLFLFIPASNTGSLERQDTKREKRRDSGRGEEAPSSFLGRAVQGRDGSHVGVDWQAARALQERRPGQGRLLPSSAGPAWGRFISLSLNFFFFFNSKLGTIPRWGKEEDGESFKKINKKNKPKVSPINPEHAWQWRGKKKKSICLNDVEGIPKTLYKNRREKEGPAAFPGQPPNRRALWASLEGWAQQQCRHPGGGSL